MRLPHLFSVCDGLYRSDSLESTYIADPQGMAYSSSRTKHFCSMPEEPANPNPIQEVTRGGRSCGGTSSPPPYLALLCRRGAISISSGTRGRGGLVLAQNTRAFLPSLAMRKWTRTASRMISSKDRLVLIKASLLPVSPIVSLSLNAHIALTSGLTCCAKQS